MKIGSLCTGYGGLDMAVEKVFGAQIAWVADNSPDASALAAYRWPVPNHGDITATDWHCVEPVDVLTAGWPCQPWSQAGKQLGAEDERAIWPAIKRAIRELGPRWVALENVPAIAGAGELARAAGDLAGLGYVGSWRCLRASDVGAPHRRARIFILATASDAHGFGRERNRSARGRRQRPADLDPSVARGVGNRWIEGWPEPAGQLRGSDAAVGGAAVPAHSDSTGLAWPQPTSRCELPSGGVVADSDRGGRERHESSQGRRPVERAATDRDSANGVDWAGYGPAIRRWETIIGRPPPAPTVVGRRGARQLAPAFVEWMMGLDDGHVTAVPGLTRNQKISLLGNGVVPRQAEAALRLMVGAA